MKQVLTIGAMVLFLPFVTFAHGGEFADADEQTATPKEMQMEQQNHEQMENLMKTFLVNGTLSQEEADEMVTLMREKMNSKNMGMSEAGAYGMMGSGADHGENMMSGGMMGGGSMMTMNLLHGLVGVTSVVWLIAGVMYLANMRRQPSIKTAVE